MEDQISKIKKIRLNIEDYFNLPQNSTLIKTRKKEIVGARQIEMYFSKIYTEESLKTIGKYLGGKDHATVLHSIGVVNNLYDTEKAYREDIDNIDKRIKDQVLSVTITQEETYEAIWDAILFLLKKHISINKATKDVFELINILEE